MDQLLIRGMQKLLFTICLLASFTIHAQNGNSSSFYGDKVKDYSICSDAASFTNESEVEDMITRILDRIGVKNRYIVISCSWVDNCQAIMYKERPYILYNPAFLDRVKKLNFTTATLPTSARQDWETLTLFAHELGHHINSHLLKYTNIKPWDMELEADVTAGFLIYLLGGNLEQAQSVYKGARVSEKGTNSHPPRQQRLDAVEKGYNDARNKYPNRAAATAPNNAKKRTEEEYSALMRRGYKLYDIEEYKNASLEFTKAIEIDPVNAEGYYWRGWALRKKKDLQDALKDFDRAIRLNNKYMEAYLGRAKLKDDDLNDKPGAMRDYNSTIELDPNYKVAYFNRAILKQSVEDNRGALLDYDKAIELDQKYTNAYIFRALIKQSLKENQGALLDYNKAIELNPKDALTFFNRAVLKKNLKDNQGALQDYNMAIELNPNRAVFFNGRAGLKAGDLYDKQGAMSDYNKAIELDPNLGDAFNNRGALKYSLEDKGGACADFRKAADLGNSNGIENLKNQCK